MKRILILNVILLGCVHPSRLAQPGDPSFDVNKKDGVAGWVCKDERQTGTLVSKRVCRRKDLMESETAATQEEMYTVNRRSGQRMPR